MNKKNVARFAVIGTPVGHSKSPAMHNAAYAAACCGWEYSAIECVDEAAALEQINAVRNSALQGLNITMPYKRLAMAQADEADVSARIAGGANVLTLRDGKLLALNTDGLGAVNAIELAADKPVAGLTACVCGTGPTSRSIAYALVSRGVLRVALLSRRASRAQSAVEEMKAQIPGECPASAFEAASYDAAAQLVPDCDIFVDATPLGMQAGDGAVIDTALLRKGQTVLDVVYGHGVTPLVSGARAQGAVAVDGSEMLVGQAVYSIMAWQESLGIEFPIDRELMRAVF